MVASRAHLRVCRFMDGFFFVCLFLKIIKFIDLRCLSEKRSCIVSHCAIRAELHPIRSHLAEANLLTHKENSIWLFYVGKSFPLAPEKKFDSLFRVSSGLNLAIAMRRLKISLCRFHLQIAFLFSYETHPLKFQPWSPCIAGPSWIIPIHLSCFFFFVFKHLQLWIASEWEKIFAVCGSKYDENKPDIRWC